MHRLRWLSPCCGAVLHSPVPPAPVVQLLSLLASSVHRAEDAGRSPGPPVPLPHPQRGKGVHPSDAPSSLGRGHPSDAPFAALLPRLASPGQEEMVALVSDGVSDLILVRMRPRVVQARGGWQGSPQLSLGEMGQQMQGRHQEWRLPLFWPWAL